MITLSAAKPPPVPAPPVPARPVLLLPSTFVRRRRRRPRNDNNNSSDKKLRGVVVLPAALFATLLVTTVVVRMPGTYRLLHGQINDIARQMKLQHAVTVTSVTSVSINGGGTFSAVHLPPPLRPPTPTPEVSSWNPGRTYFSDPLNLNNTLGRGFKNVLHVKSGCQMASWVFVGRVPLSPRLDDCRQQPNEKKLATTTTVTTTVTKTTTSDDDVTERVQENDTIYVPFAKLDEFTDSFLPNLTTSVVLISSQWHKTAFAGSNVSVSPTVSTTSKVLNSTYVLHWFISDIGLNSGGHDQHPKVSPFPYGILDKKVSDLRDVFLEEYPQQQLPPNQFLNKKTNSVYYGHLGSTAEYRQNIPRGPKLSVKDHFRQLAASYYVVSPDGDRPECYRHYEALAFGCIPITQLDPTWHRHLKDGPVVFNNTNWTLSYFEATLPLLSNSPPPTVVNRNMAFEEYWMEYAERTVGRHLRWWDVLQNSRSTVADLKRENMT
mmetsp:Transcript_15736/g.39164  ORF Transcript_15736/g.39164 Transcript_15736/m.39164 type:complete len:491 (+) Transcript_15736:273-1745(+)